MQPGSEKSTSIPGNLTKPEMFNACGPFQRVLPGTKFSNIFNSLKNGEHLCLEGTFGFALTFYSWLKKQNQLKIPVKDYQSSRKNLDQFRSLTSNLMVRIHDHKATLEKAPEIPWLKDFYPEKKEFLIRFSDFLGMNGAWQWFSKGIKFPVLDQKVHPFYGVYFPTRHEHLLLFDNWLAKNTGFSKALDIGTGCGVLALMMLKHGIPFVHATDINPNAVYSATLEFEKRGLQSKTLIEQAPFTGSYEAGGRDLIVFNPPWIPAQVATELDQATYYEPGFFDQFFAQVQKIMNPETTLAILFSDFAKVAGITNEHPIENEIQNKSRFVLTQKLQVPVRQKPSVRKNWLAEIRQHESVELWMLKVGELGT